MSSWRTWKLIDLTREASSGAKVYHRPDNSMYKSAVQVAFWCWLLSAGDPDIIDQVVKILGTFT
jgi:hypothetical protein